MKDNVLACAFWIKTVCVLSWLHTSTIALQYKKEKVKNKKQNCNLKVFMSDLLPYNMVIVLGVSLSSLIPNQYCCSIVFKPLFRFIQIVVGWGKGYILSS